MTRRISPAPSTGPSGRQHEPGHVERGEGGEDEPSQERRPPR